MALAYKGMSLGELGKLNDALFCFKKALAIDKDYDLANMGKQKALELLKSQKSKIKPYNLLIIKLQSCDLKYS